MYISPHWLKDRFKNYSDDDLYDCLNQVKSFGGNEQDIAMMEMECKRRSEEREHHLPNIRSQV